MELSPYVDGLRRDLGALTRFAPDEVARLAEQLAEALDSSVRLTLLQVLSAAASEITDRLDATVIDVRLSGGEPEFVVTVVAEPDEAAAGADPPAEQGADEAGTARVTLRLSETLKTRVEAQASAGGVSVNTWLIHAAVRALDDPAAPGQPKSQRVQRSSGHRITGFARS
jgi:predicted component of type VI protein secretion system